ncbi:MAG TPA: hypothetical protein VII95_20230 [Terriglobales bacterium]|jgi:hypothetical protein
MIWRCVGLAALVTSLATLALPRPAFSSVASPTQQPAKTSAPADDPSGMYSFLREGEFVQLTMEDGKVSGFISRFGDADSDKGQFIDQFFDKATLAGDHLSFNTKTVHGVWYEFTGVITITPGKQPGQEDYRVIKGTLVQHATDASHHDKASQRQVELKSFPLDLSKP